MKGYRNCTGYKCDCQISCGEKGLITQAEFMHKLSAERAVYQAMLEKMR